MSKFIYLVSLKDEMLEDEKYIKKIDLFKELNEYINILHFLEESKDNILFKIKSKVYINKKNKIQNEVRKKLKNTIKNGDKIIISKDIIRNKYIAQIEYLLGKKNISYNSNSILQNSTILELAKQYNNIAVLFKGEISNELLEEYIKVFKYVDCYVPRKILKNENKIENLNYIYGTNIRIISSTDLSSYNIIINVDLKKEYLNYIKFKREVIIIDDNNYISMNEINHIKIDKCIKYFYTRENIGISIKKPEKYANYFISQIEYLCRGVDK